MGDDQANGLLVSAMEAMATGFKAIAEGRDADATVSFARAKRCGDALHVLHNGAESTLAVVVQLSAERDALRAIVRGLAQDGPPRDRDGDCWFCGVECVPELRQHGDACPWKLAKEMCR